MTAVLVVVIMIEPVVVIVGTTLYIDYIVIVVVLMESGRSWVKRYKLLRSNMCRPWVTIPSTQTKMFPFYHFNTDHW